MVTYPQILVNGGGGGKNIFIRKIVKFESHSPLEKDFENRGRVLIRPSGTEPFVVL